MYRAKETQTDVALYEERHDHYSPAKLALTAELRAAVEGERIVVWYQPELDLRTGEVVPWRRWRAGSIRVWASFRRARSCALPSRRT